MAADRSDSFEASTGLDAIRAIQAKSQRTKMELSADYPDYADYFLWLQIAG
jgi:hypothetical protein